MKNPIIKIASELEIKMATLVFEEKLREKFNLKHPSAFAQGAIEESRKHGLDPKEALASVRRNVEVLVKDFFDKVQIEMDKELAKAQRS